MSLYGTHDAADSIQKEVTRLKVETQRQFYYHHGDRNSVFVYDVDFVATGERKAVERIRRDIATMCTMKDNIVREKTLESSVGSMGHDGRSAGQSMGSTFFEGSQDDGNFHCTYAQEAFHRIRPQPPLPPEVRTTNSRTKIPTEMSTCWIRRGCRILIQKKIQTKNIVENSTKKTHTLCRDCNRSSKRPRPTLCI